MKFVTHEHRFGEHLIKSQFPSAWNDICDVISSVSDDDIIKLHEGNYSKQKSISKALNHLFRDRFVEKEWKKESYIFADRSYQRTDNNRPDGVWRLDFANPDNSVSVEVSYNHGEALAWNLLKPVLASELNHVEKSIQTQLGVIILATQGMKIAGGFDGAIGTFEKAVQYLDPLRSQLTVPMVLVGLEAPRSFRVNHIKASNKTLGRIQRL